MKAPVPHSHWGLAVFDVKLIKAPSQQIEHCRLQFLLNDRGFVRQGTSIKQSIAWFPELTINCSHGTNAGATWCLAILA
jgi:hypothetical protein